VPAVVLKIERCGASWKFDSCCFYGLTHPRTDTHPGSASAGDRPAPCVKVLSNVVRRPETGAPSAPNTPPATPVGKHPGR
jgi:hypothetical protein